MSNGMSNGGGPMPACSEAGGGANDAPSSQQDSNDQNCQTGPKGELIQIKLCNTRTFSQIHSEKL